MKTFLLHKNRDFDPAQSLPRNEEMLVQDLELNTLFSAMALGDKFLLDVIRRVILLGADNLDTILYRQDVLKDCLRNDSIVREIYNTSIELIERKKKSWYGIFGKSPSSILYNSLNMLEISVDILKKLRNIADEHAGRFESEGFKAFFSTIGRELSDDFFISVQEHMEEMKFRRGVLVSAELGKGNEGTNYVLRRPKVKKQNWMQRMLAKRSLAYVVYIADRDIGGSQALSALRDKGINIVANALAQSARHIDSFFNMLRLELAFYIGCLNLHSRLAGMEAPVSFPLPVNAGERKHSFKGLYDVCLALIKEQKIVANEVGADEMKLVVITGANQGGKSTFLRSIGLAQLMMQCGMFVPAEFFCANICEGIFTHYKREEDTTMKSGKLDEELARMNEIVDSVKANSMILFNESFAATNEREGSEIAGQIVCALLEKGIKIFFVTHLYQFACGISEKRSKDAMFLRAERQTDGSRTFKLSEGKPIQTSYGVDVYKPIFGTDP